MRPKELKRAEQGLDVMWDGGTARVYAWEQLRRGCECATCREFKKAAEFSGASLRGSIQAKALELLGNYAVEVIWQDGHRSIYTFERLEGWAA